MTEVVAFPSPDTAAPFGVLQPECLTSPFVFNSPHSGRVYPDELIAASRLDAHTLRKSEDSFVEELFAHAASKGAPLLHAHFPRAYLDLNREAYELDPQLIAGVLPDFANTQSVRVLGGLGTIPRVVTEQEEIYREPISLDSAIARIERFYIPYHETLRGLLDRALASFGVAILIDCHSMPSNATGEPPGSRPDFVLGDRFGASCAPELTRVATRELRSMGYTVALNKPYAGGFITEHYGRPNYGFHALQMEINRALYMNEASYEKSSAFETLKAKLCVLIDEMLAVVPRLIHTPHAAAAE